MFWRGDRCLHPEQNAAADTCDGEVARPDQVAGVDASALPCARFLGAGICTWLDHRWPDSKQSPTLIACLLVSTNKAT
jgi:hypothetical protein